MKLTLILESNDNQKLERVIVSDEVNTPQGYFLTNLDNEVENMIDTLITNPIKNKYHVKNIH
jgi:hypothetical protein